MSCPSSFVYDQIHCRSIAKGLRIHSHGVSGNIKGGGPWKTRTGTVLIEEGRRPHKFDDGLFKERKNSSSAPPKELNSQTVE